MEDNTFIDEFSFIASKTWFNDLDKIIQETALVNGFGLEQLPGIKSDYCIWSGGYNLMLRKGDESYRFFLAHHEANFEENRCLENEKFLFSLEKDNVSQLDLSVILQGYSDHSGDTSGISCTDVKGTLYSNSDLPSALFEKLKKK